MFYREHLAWTEFELTVIVVIGTDYMDSKSNYHTITSTTAPIVYIITTSTYICLTPQVVMFDIGRQSYIYRFTFPYILSQL